MLELQNISKAYGDRTVLSDISLSIEKGEIVSILGPSGCGKTTLLNLVLGLVTATDGRILFDGVDLTHVPMEKRGFNIVFQDYALFPNLNAYENIVYGLRNRPDVSTRSEVDDLIDLLGLRRHLEQRIDELSGGQKQLVFMAQAFVARPKVLLLDEPTSALALRHQLVVMEAARRYAAETGAVCLAVVHDLLTASRFSRSLLLLEEGRISALASPEEVLRAEKLEPVYHVDVSVEQSRSGFLQVVPLRPHSIAHEHGGHHGDH